MTAFLLCVTALISYSFGSLSTPILSSHIFFHENILKYSRDNVGITRFLKHYGWKGVIKLLAVEVLKVVIPVSIGGLLMLIVGHADVGFAFALFCVVLGTNFPILYRFRGEPSLLAVAVGSFFVNGEVAFAGVIVFAVVYIVSRYVSLSAIIAMAFMCLVAVMSIDAVIVRNLVLLIGVLVLLEYRRSIVRLIKGNERKFRYKKDVTYMFDDDYGRGNN